MTVSAARVAAFTAVRRTFEHGAYTDRALRSAAAGLDRRERALAMRLAFGTVQRRATLDHIAERFSDRGVERLEPAVLAALRLGLYQVLFLGGVADHAAVNEAVELAKRDGRQGFRLVNAVLRRAVREGAGLLGGLDDSTPDRAAVLHSVPRWLAAMWWSELGPERARGLLRAINEPAESALRVNTLVMSANDAVSRLPVRSHPAPGLPEGLILDSPFDVEGSELWRTGAIMAQSRASMNVARQVDPAPGELLLDLCAAPGGKTTHLAALSGDRAEIVAVERNPARGRMLRETCARMRAESVRIEVRDAAAYRAERAFDRVLADPPCSGLGTLQSRPDVRWRASPESIAELAELQARIMAAAVAATGPGGQVVYSVCTISRAESDQVVDRVLAEARGVMLEEAVQLFPDRDRTDGFYIARLRRE